MLNRIVFSAAAVFLALVVATTALGVPHVIDLQGELTDAEGNAVGTDVYWIKFRICDAAATGI